jgi:DNA-directed RNA polymerase specialized sigma24 family protein
MDEEIESGDARVRQLEAMYKRHFAQLAKVAMTRYGVPQPAAEELAHNVLLSSLRHARRIRDLRPWLFGAIQYAARDYVGRNK